MKFEVEIIKRKRTGLFEISISQDHRVAQGGVTYCGFTLFDAILRWLFDYRKEIEKQIGEEGEA